jgi:hypothetical protein
MEDVSSFQMEMIFHHRTDWGQPPRFTWFNAFSDYRPAAQGIRNSTRNGGRQLSSLGSSVTLTNSLGT